MAAVVDLDEVLEQFHLAQGEFAKGNPEPCKRFFSHREDVTLNNPLSPRARMGAGCCDYGPCRSAVQGWRVP
jgi:hypothetical protein